jgi:DNA (cytosine-5)-methyltransferase 1
LASHGHNASRVGVIDIFAGPGGLGEGFSSYQAASARHPFEIVASAEMDRSAHSTLALRAFYRALCQREGQCPEAYTSFLKSVVRGEGRQPREFFAAIGLTGLWEEATAEAMHITLGEPEQNRKLYGFVDKAKRKYGALVLIGGPPCQAYSLVGRARQTNVGRFRSHGDHRHFLYREYLGILAKFEPDVFIMENVKGMLSSSVGGRLLFDRIRRDLANPSRAIGRASSARVNDEYVLLPVVVPPGVERTPELAEHDATRFVIRCEEHGIPQARHRVIIMGVRRHLLRSARRADGIACTGPRSVAVALSGLPRLRSGISNMVDADGHRWLSTVEQARSQSIRALRSEQPEVSNILKNVQFDGQLARASIRYSHSAATARHGGVGVLLNHETRTHMPADLARYLYCAAFAEAHGRSPTSHEFPKALSPAHRNWNSGHFADRFRVQVRGRPATTVTSHLSKDGHAFIHWDPAQCRSLTVREAARLQTFPDDYLFLGNRTQQYVQVGNAVPPAIAGQIAGVVWSILKGS